MSVNKFITSYLISLLICMSTVALGSKAFQASQLELRLKKKINEVVGRRLDENFYYVLIKVDETSIPEEQKNQNVPFSNLKIDPSKLDKLINGNIDEELLSVKYTIEIVFDENVPKKKQELISNEITHFLRIDGTNKKISSSQDVINPQEIDNTAAKDIEIETLKLESEKVRLEKERLEFEAIQKEAELLEKLKKKEEEIAEKSKVKEVSKEPEKKVEEKPVEEVKEPTILEQVKDFQIAIFALIAGLIFFMSAILSSLFRSKSMNNLSKALESVGEGIQAAGAGSQDQASGGATDSEVASTPEEAQPTVTESNEETTESKERMNDFLRLVEEKISILSQEGNLAFYRHFIDMIEENPIYANAILVAVNSETAKILVKNISTDYMTKIKNIMATEGALSKAQSLRGKALQEFYGKISLDEFTGSPLLNIKNISWLTKLQNSDMLSIALELGSDERGKFLACFTPARLISILNLCQEDKQKEDIIDAIKDIDQIEEKDYEEIFEKTKQTWDKINSNREEQVKKLIDGPRFFAKMIQDLKGDAKTTLLEKLSSRGDLMEEIKQYYIPFTDVEKLSDDTVKNIFAKRPTNQVAQILFSASESIREIVIKSMSEMLQDTVREEITSLDNEEDKIKMQANKQKSQELQDEICRYLLKMNKEGLLSYKDDSNGEAANLSAA